MDMVRNIFLKINPKSQIEYRWPRLKHTSKVQWFNPNASQPVFALLCISSDSQGLQFVVDSHSSFRCMQGHIEWLAWQHHSVASIYLFLCPASAQGELQGKPCHISEGACSPAESTLFGLLRESHHYGRYISIQCTVFLRCGTLITHLMLKRRTFCSSTVNVSTAGERDVHLTTISVAMSTEP